MSVQRSPSDGGSAGHATIPEDDTAASLGQHAATSEANAVTDTASLGQPAALITAGNTDTTTALPIEIDREEADSGYGDSDT